jgi:hypothetical protein
MGSASASRSDQAVRAGGNLGPFGINDLASGTSVHSWTTVAAVEEAEDVEEVAGRRAEGRPRDRPNVTQTGRS